MADDEGENEIDRHPSGLVLSRLRHTLFTFHWVSANSGLKEVFVLLDGH